MLHAVIMAGGSGTRFWPQSRQQTPKQLLKLTGDRTMIQQTVDRCRDWAVTERTWIVTNHVQAGKTVEQLPELPSDNILEEPCARNTAPCVGLAAIRILHDDPDATMFVMPADHVIQSHSAFSTAVTRAAAIVEQDPQRLVLFGVKPTFPATGYGYIERGTLLDDLAPPAYQVGSFREKPQQEIAQQYLSAGHYYWNCGIFCWKAKTIVNLLQQFEPAMYEQLQRIAEAYRIGTSESVIAAEFPRMHGISIDYAVLEKASAATVIEAPFDWDDVGSWLAVPRLNGSDPQGNTVDGLFCGIDTSNCIVRSSDRHLIAALGVENLIIVHTEDATLVADVNQSERIREILAELERRDLKSWL